MTKEEWLDIFADNLVDILKENDMTQKDLARAIGMTEGTVSKYINKEMMPTLKAVVNMSHVLNYDVDELVYFDDRID